MIDTLQHRTVTAILSVSLRQVATAVIAMIGNIYLARVLGLGGLGIFAVSVFVMSMVATLLDFGLHNGIIRTPGVVTREFLETAFSIKCVAVLVCGACVFVIVAPLASMWYTSDDLLWLISLSFLGVAVSSLSKLSQSLLEKDMEYGKLSVLETLATLAFYVPAVALAHHGFGVLSLAVGEISRGLVSLAAYYMRPFRIRFGFSRDAAREIFSFGRSYLGVAYTWMATAGLNPIVVAKIVGLEAAGIIRLAEGIVSQLTIMKGVTDRISYPTLTQLQTRKADVAAAVESGRIYQVIFGNLPLFLFTAMSYWLVPLLYGEAWYPVVYVLPLLCCGVGINTVFGLYSSALITVRKNWQVAQFHVAYATLLWALAPVLVYLLGYLGVPLAALMATPAYLVIHRHFVRHFGLASYRRIAVLLGWSLAATGLAWALREPVASAAVFLAVHVLLFTYSRGLREDLGRLGVLLDVKRRAYEAPAA
jgi:O-antigen/teichoic acid export membrane protein